MYYDKMGILKPEFVADNGYRYYAMPQYLTLEIILFLRKLDISIPDIKYFLLNRSKKEILTILKEKEAACQKTLQDTQALLHSLQAYRKNLECAQHFPLGQVLLQNYPDSRMFLTQIPKNHRGGFNAISIRANHVHEAFAHSYCKDKPTGWVISQEDFFTKNFKHSSAIVTQSGLADSPLPCNYIRPSGLYVSVMLKGAYFHHALEAYDKMTDFMKINHLTPDGDVFLFPVLSYWATNDPEEYINSISVKVLSTSNPPKNRISVSPSLTSMYSVRDFLLLVVSWWFKIRQLTTQKSLTNR